MNDTERRYTRGLVEVREQGQRTVGGYAAKFNKLSQNLGGFVERIDPGFFNKSAGDGWPDVMARYNHSDAHLLGTTAARTLRLALDGDGLDYTVDLPAHRADVLELISRGDVRQSSFAFRIAGDGDDWSMTEQGYPLRTLLAGQLVDVAPVNSPAYLDTTTGLRSLARRVEADVTEVRAAAETGSLRKFFSDAGRPVVIDLARAGAPGPAPEGAADDGMDKDLADLLAQMSDSELAELGDLAEALQAEGTARSRFSELSAKLAAKGAHDPDALAAYIGRKKYGKKGMAALAAAGRKKASRDAGEADVQASASTGQGDTHPVLAVRLRHAALMEKRRSPLEQGATHSAPSTTTERTE